MANDMRPADMKRINSPELANAFIEEQIAQVQAQVGDKRCFWPCPAAWILPW